MNGRAKRKIIVFSIIDAILIIALVVVILIVNNHPVDPALDLINQEFNTQLSEAKNDAERAEAYSSRAGSLYNLMQDSGTDYKSEILKDAYKADELNPTAFSALNISGYEEEFGDTKKSEEYYEIFKERDQGNVKIEG